MIHKIISRESIRRQHKSVVLCNGSKLMLHNFSSSEILYKQLENGVQVNGALIHSWANLVEPDARHDLECQHQYTSPGMGLYLDSNEYQMAIGGGFSWIIPISLCAHALYPNTALNPFGHQKGK